MKKILIIGGGVAGLTAGIYAQRYGFQSVIYEKHSITGGQCTGWNRKGFHIDNCIHYLTGSAKGSLMNDVWRETGALGDDVELIRPESFGVYEFAGEKVSLYNDFERLQEELLRVSPEDRELILELIKDTKTFQAMEIPADKPMDMYSPIAMMKLGMKMKDVGMLLKKYGMISCKEYASRFKSRALQQTFATMMPEYYSAQALIFTLSTVAGGNGDIPKGGSLAMAMRMQKKYQELGGHVITGALVEEILVQGKQAVGIRLADGTTVEGDYVIAAGDVHYTLHTLLNNKFPDKAFESRWQEEEQRQGSYPIPSSAHVTFAVDADLKDYPVAMAFASEEYQVGVSKFDSLGIRNYAYEPGFAPEGKSVINTFISQYDRDYEWWEKLYQDKNAYETYKQKLAQDILQRMEQHFPELAGKLSVIDVYTPVTYHNYCNAYHGAWMSFVMTPGSKSLMHNGKIKGLGNCFLAGMWLQPPGGLPVAAVTGKYAVQRICRCEGMKV